MSWTNAQKSTLARACAALGWSDDQRRMVLSSLFNAHFDRAGHRADRPTSTSRRLNNRDFEQAMAVVERAALGRVDRFSAGYWAGKAQDELARMQGLAARIANTLELERDAAGNPLLDPDGAGLRGWIVARVTRDDRDRLEQLDYNELYNLIEGLKAYGRRHGVRWQKE